MQLGDYSRLTLKFTANNLTPRSTRRRVLRLLLGVTHPVVSEPSLSVTRLKQHCYSADIRKDTPRLKAVKWNKYVFMGLIKDKEMAITFIVS